MRVYSYLFTAKSIPSNIVVIYCLIYRRLSFNKTDFPVKAGELCYRPISIVLHFETICLYRSYNRESCYIDFAVLPKGCNTSELTDKEGGNTRWINERMIVGCIDGAGHDVASSTVSVNCRSFWILLHSFLTSIVLWCSLELFSAMFS